jgi:ACS family hexuronate transporter-like MFS transporter
MLLICRLLLGIFEAGNWPCGVLTVKRVMKPEERSLGNAIFQSGTALGAIITPWVVLACFLAVDPLHGTRIATSQLAGGVVPATMPPPEMAWRLPFLIVGAIGILWVFLWLWVVRSKDVAAPPPSAEEASEARGSVWKEYMAIWKNRRFWVLIVVIVGVNVTWRSWGFWLPKFMQEARGYSETTTQIFSSAFFFVADIGSITVGIVTLALSRRGWTLHRARLLVFTICGLLTTLSIAAVLLPAGWTLMLALLLVGVGSLGLFPTYFALSQEISSRHQAKVTGTLGAINAACMAIIFPLQGLIVKQTGTYAYSLGIAGLTPMLAVLAVAFFWNRDADKPGLMPIVAK